MRKEYWKLDRKAKGKIRELRDGHVTTEVPLPIGEVLIGITERLWRRLDGKQA